jgi:hypothetical protein
VKVQVAVGPKMSAFRFEWRDVKKDDDVIRHKSFRDAVAIQFVPGGRPREYVGIPFIGMGDKKKAVRIWHWKADWEAQVRGNHREVAQHMDRMVQRFALSTKKRYLAGVAAGNALSARKRKSSVETLTAKGFGSLTRMPARYQTVQGRGQWLNGRWVVVMRLPNNSAAASHLRRGRPLPVAIAVWDGGAGDRNGQKSVSQWMELVME